MKSLMQGGEEVTHLVHTQKIVGATPTPASKYIWIVSANIMDRLHALSEEDGFDAGNDPALYTVNDINPERVKHP